MDIFPNELVKLLDVIVKDHNISSWRINSGFGLVVSIRFQSHDTCTPLPTDKYYRSKPPSAKLRDTERQQLWFDNKTKVSMTDDSGYGNTFVTQRSSTPGMTGYNLTDTIHKHMVILFSVAIMKPICQHS